jgi:hypothetical protein
MKEAILKEILYDLGQVIDFFQKKDGQSPETLRKVSDHAIDDVALHKDFDVVSITVLIYSIYKVLPNLRKHGDDITRLIRLLQTARDALKSHSFGKYNAQIRSAFKIVRECSADVKEHLQDVMQAARVKKGTSLLQKGLSIGQAAGLMGLSNWDLQEYAAKTTILGAHTESLPAKVRLLKTLRLFNLK